MKAELLNTPLSPEERKLFLEYRQRHMVEVIRAQEEEERARIAAHVAAGHRNDGGYITEASYTSGDPYWTCGDCGQYIVTDENLVVKP